jgi:hypothetical protein
MYYEENNVWLTRPFVMRYIEEMGGEYISTVPAI